jgi:hypothetical protein
MTNKWNDASVTPPPKGVLLDITYRTEIGTYETTTGSFDNDTDFALIGDGYEIVDNLVSWRYMPERDIPVAIPSKAFPGLFWVDGVLDLSEGAFFKAYVYQGTSGTTWRVCIIIGAAMQYRRETFPTRAEAVAKAEQLLAELRDKR